MSIARSLALGAVVFLLASPLDAQDAGTPANRIVVEASGFRNDHGHLRCALFAHAEDFPQHRERAILTTSATITGTRARCVFEGVEPGTYAIALHHDEDDEGDFDTGIFGIPTEGVGASRDAHGSMGPPSFRDAQVDYTSGELRLRVQMQYVF